MLVAIGGEIHAARDATKVNSERVTCFASRDGGPVGMATKHAVTFISTPERRVHLAVERIGQRHAGAAHELDDHTMLRCLALGLGETGSRRRRRSAEIDAEGAGVVAGGLLGVVAEGQDAGALVRPDLVGADAERLSPDPGRVGHRVGTRSGRRARATPGLGALRPRSCRSAGNDQRDAACPLALPEAGPERAETINWLMWQVGAAPFVGGGFGHFYVYAPFRMEYPIDRYAMEVKRQLHLLDAHLADRTYMIGDRYTIADIAIWPWYGGLMNETYGAQEFLGVKEYRHLARWAERIAAREPVQRGTMVNRLSGPPERQLRERHDAGDFDNNRQDQVEARGGKPV